MKIKKTCQQSGIVTLSNFYYKLVKKTTKKKEMYVWEMFVCFSSGITSLLWSRYDMGDF
jgi:hypothetical protein